MTCIMNVIVYPYTMILCRGTKDWKHHDSYFYSSACTKQVPLGEDEHYKELDWDKYHKYGKTQMPKRKMDSLTYQ